MTLYLVATPIGHLSDITLRAIDILRQVDVIASEDTRHSLRLLKQYGVSARLVSIHMHNEQRSIDKVLQLLKQGCSVAYISDAGTPAVSDPGARLVHGVRLAGFPVVPIPGVSSLSAALSVAGMPSLNEVLFAGFLPAKEALRKKWLFEWVHRPCGICFFEAPHRVRDTFQAIVEIFEPTRQVTIARELTKCFEQIVSLRVEELLGWCELYPNHLRGEFVVVIAPPAKPVSAYYDRLGDLLIQLCPLLPASTVARVASDLTGIDRKTVYQQVLQYQATLNIEGKQDVDDIA